jgi:alkylresorcinol/alkylpyrone synthase
MDPSHAFRARLAGVASAMPAHTVGPEETALALRRLFPAEDPALIDQLVERSGVETRHLALPLEETLRPRDFTQRNRIWREAALALSERAARAALARAGIAPAAIDVVLDVSCTGVAIPALDVALVPLLGLRHDVLRLPITESGCAAGALALGVARSFAERGGRVLVIACELCSLTFVGEDVSRTNLVASVLFGDGAAAAVVAPGDGPEGGQDGGPDGGPDGGTNGASRVLAPCILATGSRLLPDTDGLMGFDVGTHGLRIVLQRELPLVLASELRASVEGFLDANGRSLGVVALHLVHPGGRRILDAYAEIFGLDDEALSISRESLRRHGNLSSASVLTLLEIAEERGVRTPKGSDALVVGVGPGLSLELSLWSFDA